MILFGRKAHHLGLKEVPHITCENCGQKKVVVSLFQRYFHILWVPVFPIKKAAASQCTSCRDVKVQAEFDEELSKVKDELSKTYQTPIWSFVGAFILISLLVVKQFVF